MPNLVTVPSLTGLVHQKVDEWIRGAAQAINQLGNSTPTQLGLSNYVTQQQLAALPAQIQKSLQANGATPLNLTGLAGQTAQPQSTNVPVVAALPTAGPLLQNGVLVSYLGNLYRYNGNPGLGQWVAQTVQKVSFTFVNQTSVTVAHNLGTTILMWQVFDATGNITTGPETFTSGGVNSFTITFGASFSGTVVVIG